MDVTGWRAAISDRETRALALNPVADLSHWVEAAVPGHWRDNEHFATSEGPVLYRAELDIERAGARAWLVFDGVFYQSDVWFDGVYLGDTEGYFGQHAFDITDSVRARTEHTVAVEVMHSRPSDPRTKRAITGMFDDETEVDPSWHPGGIWQPVRIEHTGPVRLSALRVRCEEATNERAIVVVGATLDADEARQVTVRTRIAGTEVDAEHALGAGLNELEWRLTVADPELWWPRALGSPTLHNTVVEVHTDDGEPSDRRVVRTGLRTVDLRRWILSVNGERIFVKGADYGPTRLSLASVTRDDIATDLDLAAGAGLDLLRVRAHIAHPRLYEMADERGMLLWQDFPLHGSYTRGIRSQATRQAAMAVDLLAHHPSIVVWCAHNAPVEEPKSAPDDGRLAAIGGFRDLASQQLPTWNKTVLDRSVKRVFENRDGTRPVIAHSGVWPHLPQLDGTDSHLWFGWRWGTERDLPPFCARLPRTVRFVSEFGAQAVPESDEFVRGGDWPDLDWDRLTRHHGLDRAAFERYVPPGDHATYAGWKLATQRYQSQLVRRHIEQLRRLKYRPTGGFCVHQLADAAPAVSTSLVDHARVPKPAYRAVAQACAPVIIVADRLPLPIGRGEAVAIDVHVVCDLRDSPGVADVTAELSWPGGEHEWAWRGDIPADGCERIGTISWVAPTTPGPVTLTLRLTGGADALNRYDSEIT